MDPNGVYKTDPLDDIKVPGVPDSGPGKTYAIITTYNDGRQVTRYYRYGTDVLVKEETGEDENRKKEWAAQQPKTSTPQDPDVDEAAKRTNREAQVLENERTWNQANGGLYETHAQRRVREAAEARTTAPQSVATNTTEPFIVTRNPDGTIKTDPNPNYQGQKPAAGSNIQVKGGDGKTYIVTIGADGKATAQDSGVPAEAKEPKITPIDGVPHELVQTPDGPVYKPVKIQGQGTVPDLGELKLQYGQVASGLQQRHRQYQDAVRAGTMSAQQADAAFKRDYELAQIQVGEINSLLSTQASGFNQQVQQRGQTLNDVESRRNLGSGAMKNAMTSVFDLGQYVTPGSISGAEGLGAMRALYGMQMEGAQQAGGMREVPEIPVPPATAQVMRLNLGGGVSLEMPSSVGELGNLQQQFGGGARPAGLMPPASGPAPAAPTETPQPVMPPQPTARVTPMSIAQSLLAEDDDPDWQYGVNKAMSLLL